MTQVQAQARTTPRVRAAIKTSSALLKELAMQKRFATAAQQERQFDQLCKGLPPSSLRAHGLKARL